jgi:hypothetical protein
MNGGCVQYLCSSSEAAGMDAADALLGWLVSFGLWGAG